MGFEVCVCVRALLHACVFVRACVWEDWHDTVHAAERYRGKKPQCSEDLFVKYAKSCAYSKSLFTRFELGKAQRDSLEKETFTSFLE